MSWSAKRGTRNHQRNIQSARRVEVAKLHALNLSNREIGKRLGLSHRAIADDLKALNLTTNGTRRGTLETRDGEGKCTKCCNWKPIEQFAWLRCNSKYPYQLTACHACRYQQGINYVNADPMRFLQRRYMDLKRRARGRHRGLPFDLSFDDVREMMDKQGGRCFYTDIELKGFMGSGLLDNSISFDRIIPEKGYVKGNVVLCARRINTVKNNLTLDEMRQWMPPLYERLVGGGFVNES